MPRGTEGLACSSDSKAWVLGHRRGLCPLLVERMRDSGLRAEWAHNPAQKLLVCAGSQTLLPWDRSCFHSLHTSMEPSGKARVLGCPWHAGDIKYPILMSLDVPFLFWASLRKEHLPLQHLHLSCEICDSLFRMSLYLQRCLMTSCLQNGNSHCKFFSFWSH